VAEIARGLALLQQARLPVRPALPLELEFEKMQQQARLVAMLHPSAAEALSAIETRLAEGLPRLPRLPLVPCHGTFKLNHLLDDGTHTSLVDFDSFVLADPIYDVANFVADLHYLEAQGALPAAVPPSWLAPSTMRGRRRCRGGGATLCSTGTSRACWCASKLSSPSSTCTRMRRRRSTRCWPKRRCDWRPPVRHALPLLGVGDLPVLERALSSAAMLECFQRFLPPRDANVWVRCDIERVSFRPGKSSRVLYRLWEAGEVDGQGTPGYFYCEFCLPSVSLRRYLDLRERTDRGRPTGFVAELDMIYWRFPADPRLGQLAGVWREGTWSVVTYTPTMGGVLSGTYGGERTIVKLLPRRPRRTRRRRDARLQGAGVTVPRVSATSMRRAACWCSSTFRRRLLGRSGGASGTRRDGGDGAPAGGAARHAAAAADAGVARARASSRRAKRAHSRKPRRAGRGVSRSSQPRLERLRRCSARRRPKPSRRCCTAISIRRSSWSNARHAVLIDFDNVCRGDPMYDLARFASHLYYKGQVHGRPLREVESAVSAFRSAYIAAGRRFVPRSWFWHLAVSLVAKRAHRVMTRLETGAGEYAANLLTIAEQNAASIVHD
jgi:hypothetical protein